ncbi:MAG TPA: hypothetical protein DDX92_11490, partial [Flavobacteriales bacterium]|nr:hypothetical protein [Flavobacteriales bacterium]
MKFSRLLAVTIPFLLSSPFLFGQPSISPPSSGNLIFDEVKSQIELYYDSVPISTSEDSTFIKEYMRWSRFWDGRLDMDGTTGFDDFPSLTAIQNAFPCTGQNSNQLWEAEGPLTRPNYVSSGAAFRGIGRIDPIAYDPTSGVIIVGSPGGALLKSIDNGSSWSSLDVNIDYGYPALGIRKILIDPTDPDIIYIATGHDAVYLNFLDTDPATWTWSSGLFKSIDGGLSWDNITPISERKGLSNMFRPIYDMEFLPSDPNTIFWTMDDKLFVTYDAGMTHSVFKSSNSGELFDEVEVVMNGTDFIVYVTSRIDDLPNLEIQRYTSSNSQWTNVVAGVPILLADTVDRVKIQTSSSSPNEVFMIYRAGKDTLSFVSSLDFGLNWSNPVKIRDKGGLNFNAFDVSHQNSNVIYLATRFGEFRSLNKGLSFTSIESYHHDDNRWVQIIGHSSNLNPSSFIDSIFIAHDGGVTRLTGNGSARSSVDLMNSAFNVAQGYDLDIGNNGSKVIVTGVHDDGTMFGSKSNWYKGAGMGGDGGTCEFLKNDKKLFFINNWALGIYDFATDTSKFFLDVCGTLVGIKERYCIGILSHNLPAHYSPQSENIVYMGYDSLYMLDVRHPKSEIWKNRRSIGITNKPAGNTSSIRHIDICESDTSVMYITTGWRDWKSQPQDSSIYKTTDGGLNWVNISVYDAASWGAKASSIKVDPYDPDQVWVVFNGYKSGSPGNPNINQKVYHSINGGQTWQNISYNIPNISVNDIEIVPSVGIPGQYDLFIATDVGVYFKEAGATVWDCFSQGLSRSFFTRLRYNSCDNRLYVSSYGKGVWSVEVPSGRHVEYRITHDETWNTYRQVSGDIIIEPGATLTIENCTISMAKGARILVASNQGGSSGAGKLIVNNATLTNNCGQHWSGIDVAGDSYRGNMSHQYTYQGLSHVGIAIINNSIIEHAEIAIENWSNGNWSSFGGRIHAENTIFRNNRRAVGFGSYKNHAYWDANKVMPYMSSFAKCTFTIDDNFREEVDPHMGFHVTMWDVQGISFLGCSFKYDVANYRQAKELSGVYSIDATYNIFPYEYSLVGGVKIESLFENLHYGVHAMGGG